jgi:class 3 adenylate cyclase
MDSLSGEIVAVDTLLERGSLLIVPERNGLIDFERVVKTTPPPDGDAERAIRESTGTLLDGFDLIETEDESMEVDRRVITSMRKTPISFADGSYEKEFLDALVLCIDLRGFSEYVRDKPKERVKDFLEKYTQELLATINLFPVSYYKLLGDGALVIWDKADKVGLDQAVRLFELLRLVLRGLCEDYEFPNNIAGGIAYGEVYKYELFAECSGLKYRDYLGYGVNYVFRLQAFAESGELLANRSIPDRYGMVLPPLAAERKPDRGALKGVRDADYEEVFILLAASAS